MGKIEEAQEILEAFGLPPAQCNELSALTLLSLANLKEEEEWSKAEAKRLRIHDILTFIAKAYNKQYAENTRETVRRQVIHQFEQARIIDKNPDNPNLPINSPRTHYALTNIALKVLKTYKTNEWRNNIKEFHEKCGLLKEIYRKNRKTNMIPVKLPSGAQVSLSPGEHNMLQARIIKEFAPRFVPGCLLLYLGDTADKTTYIDNKILEELGISVSEHSKLPDIIFYDKEKNILFLIEAVTSHGPVSPKRQYELEKMLSSCKAKRIYISAFQNFTEFKKHIENIAWETEVWLADIPDHLIHFNGDKFLNH